MFSSNFAPEESKIPSALKIGAAAAAAGALYLAVYHSPIFQKTEVGISRETLREVVRELLREFHGVMVEMSQMAVRVRQVLALKGMSDQLTDEQLIEVLMTQGVQEKMEQAQAKVLTARNLTEAEVEEAQGRYSEDPMVKLFESGIDEMFKIASTGEMPVLPGVVIPESLTPDLALQISSEILDSKSGKFRSVIRAFYETNPPETLKEGPALPPQELAEALQAANDSSETEILQKYSDSVSHKSIFNSAVAVYSKDTAFAKERRRQDRCHQAEIMKIMTNKEETKVTNIQVIDGLSPRLQPVTEDTLPVVLMEAAESSFTVVVAMVKPETVDIQATLKPISEALDNDSLLAGPVFTWMKATEESPLTQNERCRDCPVVYVVFARPEVQRRPIACLSLDELRSALKDLSS